MKKILILGAARYYLRSIESAKKAGYYVIAIDRSPGSEGFKCADEGIVCDIVDKTAVLKIADEKKIDGIIPINDFGVPTAAHVSEKLDLPGISRDTALLCTNKEEMRKKWQKDGVPCPVFAFAEKKEEFLKAVEKTGLPCVFKPAHGVGGGSRGVIVVREKREIEGAIRFSQSFYEDKRTVVESFIDAEHEHSAEVIAHDGKINVIAVSDRIKGSTVFTFAKNVLYPTAVSGERLQILKEQIKSAVKSLGINIGAAHVELATTRNGFVLFELGARCGGGGTPEPIVPFATGVEEFIETVRVLTGDKPVNLRPVRNFGCNYHFLTPKPGILKKIKGLDEVRGMEGVLDADVFIKPGGEIKEIRTGPDVPGFVITGAKTRNEAYDIGLKAESKIIFEYAGKGA